LGEEMHEVEIQGPRPIGRPKRTWTEDVKKEDCEAGKLKKRGCHGSL